VHLNVRGEADSGVTIYYSYSPAHKNDPDRALRILTRELERDPSLKRERFYLAREYVYRKQWDQAIQEYKAYLKIATWQPEIADSFYSMAYCYKMKGDWPEARKACLQAIGINPDYKRALRLMAQLSWPYNRAKWNKIADAAQNKDVLFT
jgi:tetratricopeptide (TPR) repeat protein